MRCFVSFCFVLNFSLCISFLGLPAVINAHKLDGLEQVYFHTVLEAKSQKTKVVVPSRASEREAAPGLSPSFW